MQSETTFDYALEASLLCSLVYYPEIPTASIDSDLFFNPLHKQILHSLQVLDQQDTPRDEIIIRDHLVRVLKVDSIIAEATLTNILTLSPYTTIEHFLARLHEFKKIRDVKTALLRLQEQVNKGDSAIELEASFLSYGQKIATNRSIELFSLHQASSVEAKEPYFVCKDFIPIPEKTVTIFSAGGGTGKTFLILQLAMRFLVENPSEKAFLWLSEDDIGIAKERLSEISSFVYKDGAKTLDRLLLSADQTFQAIIEENRSVKSNPLLYKMKLILKDIKFIVLDPLIAFYGGDENNNAHARQFMQLFTHWAAEEDKIIIFIHHSTKNTTQSRGASALVDAARAVYEVDRIKDADGNERNSSKRLVSLTKDNYRASKYFGGYKKEIMVFPPDKIIAQPVQNHFLSIDEELGIS